MKRQTWFLFDSESNVISEEYETLEQLVKDNPPVKNGRCTYAKVLNDDKCWYEVIEEYTENDILEMGLY